VSTQLDLIAIGRVSVDLYGQQLGSALEDVSTFAKAVGGCPANVAIGAARLGLKSALISRVGDEPMGRFVREQLTREGVDARSVLVDAQHLTSLVLLSVRDDHTFPLILWGIGGHGAGETRYARSARVTNAHAPVLPECDLIVGTEEELHVAAGLEDTLEAVRHVRSLSPAVIVGPGAGRHHA
jgi:sugar/nucleoside kinase (ribokinase family)